MSYYRPNFSQTSAMTRGRGYSSSRGSGYRGSNRGGSSWGSSPRGGYSPARGSGNSGRFSSSFNSSFDSRSKYGSSDRYSSRPDDYRKSSYRPDSSRYSGGDHRGSPDRKRMRTESLSSRHDGGYGGSGDSYGRYDSSSGGGYGDRRSFSSDRRSSSFSRREEFRKPAPPPPSSSPRGGYRGRISSRGSMRSRLRERPTRRRLVENSYIVRKRTVRPSDYSRRIKMARMRSAVVRRSSIKKSKSDNEESGNEKEEVADEEKKPKSEKDEHEEEKEGETKEEEKKETPKKIKSEEREIKKESDTDDKSSSRKKYIKLVCPHCQSKCGTFGKYSLHLQSGRHISAMRRVAMKQKAILSRMRLMQRNAQRELEKTTDDLASRTSFCPLCKLNYKQPKLTHQSSESHKNMKKFLMPYCKTCKITFKSPMLYESHCCSIEHIKRKAFTEDKSDKDEGSGVDDNLENFMTIDSVGDMDEEEREKKKESDDSSKPKEQINVGIEHIKKVEVYYCDLCSMYLPRREESEMPKKIAEHCKQRTHLRRYVSYKEDKELAKRAERLQRRETLEKEKEKEKEEMKPVEDTVKKEVVKENGEAIVNDDEGEEKLWADVDKDLGIILAEAESGNKSSDEDEDDSVANGGRYDRFKTGEKSAEEKKLTDDVKEEESLEADPKVEENEDVEAK